MQIGRDGTSEPFLKATPPLGRPYHSTTLLLALMELKYDERLSS